MADVRENQQAQQHQAQQQREQRLSADKQKIQQDRESRAKLSQERYEKRGTPTPTQEEADLLKLGHPVELADDGSGPDPYMSQEPGHQAGLQAGQPTQHQQRHQEASQSGPGYSTRQTAAHKPQSGGSQSSGS
jgi:hypothetical protein